jgi:hypothetical protein
MEKGFMNLEEIKQKVFHTFLMKLSLSLSRNISKNMREIKMSKVMEIQDGFWKDSREQDFKP